MACLSGPTGTPPVTLTLVPTLLVSLCYKRKRHTCHCYVTSLLCIHPWEVKQLLATTILNLFSIFVVGELILKMEFPFPVIPLQLLKQIQMTYVPRNSCASQLFWMLRP